MKFPIPALKNPYTIAALGALAWMGTGCHTPSRSPAGHSTASGKSPDCCAPPSVSADPAKPVDPELARMTSTPWRSPAERPHRFPFQYRITEQTGRKLQPADLMGKPFAATFLYTRCENTNKCPLVARTFGRLQRLLQQQGLEQKANLLLITYDPEHDSPADLVQFGERFDIKAQGNTWLLRPDPGDKKRFFETLNVAVNFNQKDVNAHRIEIMLFDAQARFVRSYHSLIWDNTEVARDLLRLTQDQ